MRRTNAYIIDAASSPQAHHMARALAAQGADVVTDGRRVIMMLPDTMCHDVTIRGIMLAAAAQVAQGATRPSHYQVVDTLVRNAPLLL